jgi:AbrB family looped-hinge helix DNA binding protein
MPSSTLTSKGQITLPKEIRSRLHLQPGDRIEYTIEDGRVYLSRATMSLDELCAILPPPPKKASIESMNAAIRRRGAALR